tara:strand:- start:191689 stop:192717 length:1029 start_codon:yes stop_codon:yes gene_type:complete
MTEPFTQAAGEMKELTADENASGRLDAWLAEAFEGQISRSRIKALMQEGAVTVNGRIVREAKHKVMPADRIEFTMPEPAEAEPQPENIPFTVLYEDDDLIVLAKPAGLVVHPGAGNWSGTLVNALLHHCGTSLSGIGGVKRPGIVHRLDKNTSGVMVAAKNDLAHRHLADQFADHGRTGPLQRAYLALVWGRPESLKGTINAPLGRAVSHRTKRAVKKAESADARTAITHYQVRQRYGEKHGGEALACLVECRLETGRTHQIRVHMEHLGHPLVGDPEYGTAFKTKINTLPEAARATVSQLDRQALHAYLLQFEHPRSGKTLRFEAPLPDDLQNVIAAFEAL